MSIITTAPNPNRVRDLERALEDVRASRPAAANVLAVTDDPNSNANDVAAAIDADPMMTAQVLRLANSAAFGMSERVASTQVAVSLVGQSAIRSIAVLLASGLRNHKNPVPRGFWSHSASTAAACAVLSSRFGVVRGDAFSLGLLHDIGTAILHSVDPSTHVSLVDADDDTTTLCIQEMLEFGMSHADAAARVLSSWNFPTAFVTAVAHHHDAGRRHEPARSGAPRRRRGRPRPRQGRRASPTPTTSVVWPRSASTRSTSRTCSATSTSTRTRRWPSSPSDPQRHRRPSAKMSAVRREEPGMHEVRGVVAKAVGEPVSIETVLVPDPGPGEALVAVQACGVCHTDLHYREGGISDDFPFLLGHEAAGVVEAVGDGVTDVAPGDFVVLNWRAVCGECRACRRGRPWYCFATHNATQKMTLADGTELTPTLGIGAFADKTLVAAGQCTKVDPAARPEVAGLLGCGVMAGIGAALNTGNVGRGDSVAVIGCGGVGNAADRGIPPRRGAHDHRRRRRRPEARAGEGLRRHAHRELDKRTRSSASAN